jgi:hypothetical protein
VKSLFTATNSLLILLVVSNIATPIRYQKFLWSVLKPIKITYNVLESQIASKGPFGRAFLSASLMASTEALPNP